MIGLSLSFCIQDLMSDNNVRILGADGVVRTRQVMFSDVTKIISNTCARDTIDWDILLDRYRQSYWRSSDAFEVSAAVETAKRLRAQGKIEQPRLEEAQYCHSTNEAHWIEDDAIHLVRVTS